LAERLGYDSLWAGEHVVVPSPRVQPSPIDPDEPMMDPLVSLAHVAAVTEQVRLGTGIIILPQRNPLVLAKQIASLDVVSGGRFIFGLAVGYLEPELRAIGVDPRKRAAMATEYLAAMESLWYDERPRFSGKFAEFAGVDAYPRPIQRPIEIVVGGQSPQAHERAVAKGDGWYGFWMDPEQARTNIEALRAKAEAAGRTRPLHISITPGKRLTPELVAEFGAVGVDRLIVTPRSRLSEAETAGFVEANAPGQVGGAVAPWA
jgi:probable F420-dependent oxidoreductase